MSTQLSPRESWQRLQDGNQRFVEGSASHPNQDAARRASLVETQHPFALVFGCSDSRVAAEIIFDLGLGDIFVVRTAGQVIDNAVLGSIEYGILQLGVPLIIVLGHDSCGAVTATLESVKSGTMPAGFQRDLVERITPSVLSSQRAGTNHVNGMVVENVKQVSQRLVETSRPIADAVDDGSVAILGVTYRLDGGKAELVSTVGSL